MPDRPTPIDCLMPPEIAARAEDVGAKKCALPFWTLLVLGILAGAFIALGAVFSTTVAAGGEYSSLSFGLHRLLVGFAFCLGLVLVVTGGAELFTGNNLIVMAWARRRVTTRGLLRNWGIVYLGNAIGALGTAVLVLLAKQHEMAHGMVGDAALRIGVAKVGYTFVQAVALGILCNALVCLAVWIAMGARTIMGRIAAIIFPITAFVAAGFEHSVANMYFVPYAMGLNYFYPEAVMAAAKTASSEPAVWELSVDAFLVNNLLPVTIGNIIGGAVLVAAVYWFVYLKDHEPDAT